MCIPELSPELDGSSADCARTGRRGGAIASDIVLPRFGALCACVPGRRGRRSTGADDAILS